MRHTVRPRRLTRTFAILAVLMLVGACGQRDTVQQRTTPATTAASTVAPVSNAVQPLPGCIADNGNGSLTTFVGYQNSGSPTIVALSDSGRRDVRTGGYPANATTRATQTATEHPTDTILTERFTAWTGSHPFAFGLYGKADEEMAWSFANQTITASPRNPQQRCRFPDADQRITTDAVSWPLVLSRYVFWVTKTGTQPILHGYDMQTRRAFVVATFADNEGPFLLAGDRAETTLAWVESGTYEGAAYQHLARIRAYDLTTSTISTLVEASAPATSFQNPIAIDNGVLFYRDITAEHSGLFARTLATGTESLIATQGSEPVVSGGMLLYTTAQAPQPGDSAPLMQLHLHRLSDHSERMIMQASSWGLQYAMSGDTIVWGFVNGDTPVHRYTISTSQDTILTKNGVDPVLAGNTVAWRETTSSTDQRPMYHTVTSLDLTSGMTTTLVTASTFVIETVGVSPLFGPVIYAGHPLNGQGFIYVTNNEPRAGRINDGFTIPSTTSSRTSNPNAAVSAQAADAPTVNAAPAVLANQVNIIGDKFHVNGTEWKPHGVQFFLPNNGYGINGKTFRDDKYDPVLNAPWLEKAHNELFAKTLRIFIDMPGERDNGDENNNLVSPGTIYRFIATAQFNDFKLGLVLHNSSNFTMTPAKRAWIQNLLRCIVGLRTDITGAIMPDCGSTDYTTTIFYLSADNELNNHGGTFGCPAQGLKVNCYDYDAYVSAARQWVQDFSDLVRQTGLQLDRQFWVTVGMATEMEVITKDPKNVTYIIRQFFEEKVGKRSLASAVDFISPHNYGGSGNEMYTPIMQAGYRQPVLLEEYGYPTDPYDPRATNDRQYYTETPSSCLTAPQLLDTEGRHICKAPYFVAQNIQVIEQHFAGGMYWMLSDIEEKQGKDCEDVDSALYTGAFAIGGTSCGGTIYNKFGDLKSTGRLVCRHHGGTIAACKAFFGTFLPLAKRGTDAPAASAAQRSSNQSADAYPAPGTPTPNPYPAPSTPTPTPTGGSYPATSILDTFDRADGAIGSPWVGDVGGYTIRSNQVEILGGGAITYDQVFGANQEVYVTLPTLNTNATEIDLLLKGQGSGQCDVLEVWYEPIMHTVQVVTCQNDVWTQQGSTLALTLQAGDRFGARALADGTVTIYQNATLVGSVQVDSTWPYRASGGRVGIWTIDASGTVLDTFGGGTLP